MYLKKYILYNIAMRTPGSQQKNIYRWKLTKYHNEEKELMIFQKLYTTVKEIQKDFDELNQDRICNYLRGMSKGITNTKANNIFRVLDVEKIRISV